MKKIPLISILIPAYNRPNYLRECIDSIVAQEWFQEDELEIIITDDSTNDESWNIIKEFIVNYKSKNIIYQKNQNRLGMVWNWNKLLDLKKWSSFIFLSDDDKFYDENSLRLLYHSLNQHDYKLCLWLRKYINENWEVLNEIKDSDEIFLKKRSKYEIKLNDILFWWNTIWFWWILFKDESIKFHEYASLFSDFDFNIRYLSNHKWLIINSYCFLYRFHTNQDSKTINKTESFILYKRILEHHKINLLFKIILLIKFKVWLYLNWIFMYKIIFFIKKLILTKWKKFL